MMSATAPAKAKPELCLVDSHPAEHDCRRVQVDFPVQLLLKDNMFSAQAVEMCGAGLTLQGCVPATIGDKLLLRISFPGRREPLEAHGVISRMNGQSFGCEFWASTAYEQQFVDGFVSACARRQELRKNGCAHGS